MDGQTSIVPTESVASAMAPVVARLRGIIVLGILTKFDLQKARALLKPDTTSGAMLEPEASTVVAVNTALLS